jgi:cytochrome c peroxidase
VEFPPSSVELTQKQLLGKVLFFDVNLSTPRGQACAVCHGPEVGWSGPIQELNALGGIYEGAVPGRFGHRNSPSSAYATPAPVLHIVREEGEAVFVGGNFWDGRATGEHLDNPAADQAQGPFLNPVEQNNRDAAAVCRRVRDSNFASQVTGFTYEQLFDDVFGPGALDCKDAAATYDRIALAIAAYEGSCEVSQFSSRFDAYLANRVELSPQEAMGLELFRGKAKCDNCHISTAGPDGEPPLFTDYTYDNLGVPRNPLNAWYDMPRRFNPLGKGWVDEGLGGFLASRPEYAEHAPANIGKMKVPTLRNVDKRPDQDFIKAFMHNGFFNSLEGVVRFYNKRDVWPICAPDLAPLTEKVALAHQCWPPPEIAENVNRDELGDLGLTVEEEAALVAFMKTLSDGYQAPRCS